MPAHNLAGIVTRHCNDDRVGVVILDIFTLCICGVGLILLLNIGLPAARIITAKKKIKTSLKCIFYAAVSFGVLSILCDFILIDLCMAPMPRFQSSNFIFACAWGFGMYLFMALMLCLLINLFLRLDVTFRQSAMRLSASTRRTIITLIGLDIFIFLILFLSGLTILIIDVQSEEEFALFFVLAACGIILFWIVYILISIALVKRFNKNLTSMIELSATSAQNSSDLKLTDSQKRMVSLSAKYMALFAVAALSSAIAIMYFTVFLVHFVLWHLLPFALPYQIYYCLAVIDVFVNIICLLLQYGYMDTAYLKYCHFMNSRCKKKAMDKVLGRIENDLIRVNSERSMPLPTDTPLPSPSMKPTSTSI